MSDNKATASTESGCGTLGCVFLVLVVFLPGFGAAIVSLIDRLAR